MTYITIDTNKKQALLFLEYVKTLSFVKVHHEKALLEIEETEDDVLIKKMKRNLKGELLSASEKKSFLNELKKVAKK